MIEGEELGEEFPTLREERLISFESGFDKININVVCVPILGPILESCLDSFFVCFPSLIKSSNIIHYNRIGYIIRLLLFDNQIPLTQN